MRTLVVETPIGAAPEKCFALLRDPRLHESSAVRHDGELAVGQIVRFPGRFLGLNTSLAVEVTHLEPPHLLVDELYEGIFREFRHQHEFRSVDAGTLLVDTVTWDLPLGPIGRLFDRVVAARLRTVVTVRNARLKALAEAY